jgi:hypothetical protein
MLKIEKDSDGENITLHLCGRIEAEHIKDLRAEIESGTRVRALDLDEVSLVARDVVKFLVLCEARGIELRNCPLYLREWILREKARAQR